MSADEMANFHQHMADWCFDKAERSFGLVSAGWESSAEMHNEAFQYWCRQANPKAEKAGE